MIADNIKKVAVIGAGIMGEGIALNFAQAGLLVRLIDMDHDIVENALTRIDHDLKLLEEFKILNDDPSSVKSMIKPGVSEGLPNIVNDCDFIVEAVPELLDLKKDLFQQLDSINNSVIICSNTSSFTISSIAEGLRHRDKIIGLHYFNPAHIIPAVEIHRGKDTSDETAEITRELMIRIGKKPVLVRKEVPGFIVNRLTGAMEREIDYLLEEEIVTPEDLDTVVKASYGFRLACIGPMQAEDMIGLDTAARVSEGIFKVLSNKKSPSPLLLEKVKNGELGIKSGKGWFNYTARSRDDITYEINKRLLRQLALFEEAEK